MAQDKIDELEARFSEKHLENLHSLGVVHILR